MIWPSPSVCSRSSAVWTAIRSRRRAGGSGACRSAARGRSSSVGGEVELGDRLAVEPDAALADRAPRLGARHAEAASPSSSGRWTVGGDREPERRACPRAPRARRARGRSAPRRSAAASAPWYRVTSARARARFCVARRHALRRRRAQQQVVPARHRGVGDRERLAVHLVRRVGDADVVAERLRHLLDAVGADQQRHGQHHLLRLAVGGLDRAAHQQVEGLVGAAELDVGVDRHRVVALEHRVEQLEQRDRLVGGEALGEVVALEQLRDGGVADEPEQRLHASCPATRSCGGSRAARRCAAPCPPGPRTCARWRRSPRRTAPAASPSGRSDRPRARCSRR